MTSTAKVTTVADLIMGKLENIEAALKAVHYTPEAAGLSPSEVALAEPRRAKCILEADATLRFNQIQIDCTLRAYGRWHRAYSGVTEKGERPSSPPEPAHYEIDSVTIQAGAQEVECYNALGEDALEAIASAAEEE